MQYILIILSDLPFIKGKKGCSFNNLEEASFLLISPAFKLHFLSNQKHYESLRLGRFVLVFYVSDLTCLDG